MSVSVHKCRLKQPECNASDPHSSGRSQHATPSASGAIPKKPSAQKQAAKSTKPLKITQAQHSNRPTSPPRPHTSTRPNQPERCVNSSLHEHQSPITHTAGESREEKTKRETLKRWTNPTTDTIRSEDSPKLKTALARMRIQAVSVNYFPIRSYDHGRKYTCVQQWRSS